MTYARSTWRLIPPLEASGTVQMAIDDWLFTQHEKGNHPPTLRFYTWSPTAISLGRLQKQWPDHWHQLTWQGHPLDLVYRSTGGRAVLHQGDLTYAVVTSLDGRRTLDMYQYICEFLIQGWRSLGIQLEYGSAKRGYIHNPSCFNTATVADLVTSDGSKVIGSAQRRGRHSVVQHGSMNLSTDKKLFETIFNQSAPWTVGLKDVQQTDDFIEKVILILTEAAKESFGIEFVNQPLSDEEWQDILG